MKLPIIGILTFVVLYLYSAYLYPGGSQADLTTESFDWFPAFIKMDNILL